MVAANMPEDGYDPRKSKVSDDRMEKWRQGTITGVLTEVPGIGPKACELLRDDPIESFRIFNTYQLVGQYLMLKSESEDGQIMTAAQTNQRFWYWLKGKGIASHRSAIVLAISEKAASFFPGIYDANADDDEY